MQRADGGVASRLLLFTPTPQSAYADSSPAGEPFGAVQTTPKNKQGNAQRPHIFTNSPVHPPQGGFHIAQAIFHCASAQFHPAPAGFHRGRKPATSLRKSGRISALSRPMLPRGPLFGQGHRARCVCPPRQDRCPLRRPPFQARPSPPQGRVCGGSS